MATKPTGPSSNKGTPASKTPARKRRSAPKAKPKTIDLKAEPAKPATGPTATPTPNAKTEASKSPSAAKAAVKPAEAKSDDTRLGDANSGETGKPADTKPTEPRGSVPKSGPSSNASSDVKADATKAPPPSKPAGAATSDTSSGAGFGALLAASLIGGLVSLGGAWILGAFEAGTPRDGDQVEIVSVADLEATRTALEERIAAIQPAETPDIAALVDARLAERPAAETGDTSAAIDAAAERIAALEASIAEQNAALARLRDAGPSAIASQNDEELTALTARVDDVASGLDGIATTVEALRAATGDVPALAARVEGAEAAQANIASRLDIIATALNDAATAREATGERIDGVTSQLDATGAALAALQQTVQQQTASTEERLATLTADLDARATAVESSTEERIASLTDRIDNGADKLAARALAAAALKRDIDTGSPFDGSLQTLANVSPDTSDLDALRPYAESGVPTTLDLRARFDSAAEEIRAATRETPPEQSFTERLLSGARNAVQINSADDAQSDSVDGIIARIDQALAGGDLAGASAEWTTLPQAGQAASSTWHDALQARITADRVVGDTVDAFLNRNAPATPTTN